MELDRPGRTQPVQDSHRLGGRPLVTGAERLGPQGRSRLAPPSGRGRGPAALDHQPKPGRRACSYGVGATGPPRR